MPSRVLQAMDEWRAALLRGEAETLRAMTRRWVLVERALREEIEAVARVAAQGGWSQARLNRDRRYRALVEQVEARLDEYRSFALSLTLQREREAALLAARRSSEVLLTAAEEAGIDLGRVSLEIDRLDAPAVERLAGSTGRGPLADLLREAAGEGVDRMQQMLVDGIALGRNPRRIAREMVREGLSITYTRAVTIARTEVMRANRQTTLANYRANDDIVQSWQWVSARDRRTCVSCWAMTGRIFKLARPLPMHPNCRCTLGPVLKVEAMPEGMLLLPPGPETFAGMSETVQRRVLGPAAFHAYRDGALRLEDFVGWQRSRDWGVSVRRRSLAEILGAERAAEYIAGARRPVTQ